MKLVSCFVVFGFGLGLIGSLCWLDGLSLIRGDEIHEGLLQIFGPAFALSVFLGTIAALWKLIEGISKRLNAFRYGPYRIHPNDIPPGIRGWPARFKHSIIEG